MRQKTKQESTRVESKKVNQQRETQSPAHVLLRVRSENGQTITAHQEVAARLGAAVLGKMGEAIGPAFREGLNEQISRGVKTCLFLTIREGWNGPYVTYECLLRHVYDVVSDILPAAKRLLIPQYYAFDTATVKTWFEIASVERMTRDEMNRIFVLSSGRSIMSVIASSATVFRVGVQGR